MPDIRPFAGILYDPGAVSLEDVVAPPYDVITPAQQAALYERSPHNIVRLILGRGADPYAEAAEAFASWLRSGVLRRDREPALYVVAQQFRDLQGQERQRTGFIGACRLEEFGGSVLPHERTHAQPKEDRLRLFEATGAMFSQIFSLYSDEAGKLDRHVATLLETAPPLFTVVADGVTNRLYRTTDTALHGVIAGFLRDRPVFIADGHHRYETALAYRAARRGAGVSGEEAWNFVPMFFTNMHADGLVIFPTHRLLRDLPWFDDGRLLEDLREAFELREMPDEESLLGALTEERRGAFGLVLPGRPRSFLLTLRPGAVSEAANAADGPLWRLDVTLLHELILKKFLAMSDDAQLQRRFLDYEHDARRAIAAARNPRVQALFLMNPTPIEDVRAVASAGLVMPQKSTHFYPKLLSGLVTYAFNGTKPA